MTHRGAHTFPALALVLAAGLAVGGCSAASAGRATAASGTTPAASSASVTASATASATAPVFGPVVDTACVAALKAEQTLQARQGKDQSNETALDTDFTSFANALSAAAGQEKSPAKAKAMNALADDYNALVESQSGAVQLPDMTTVQNDGTAFQKACS